VFASIALLDGGDEMATKKGARRMTQRKTNHNDLYVVMVSGVPGKFPYYRCGVVKRTAEAAFNRLYPKMLSKRAKDVEEIIELEGHLTPAQLRKTLPGMRALADALNQR
jgi:hypothetical protein